MEALVKNVDISMQKVANVTPASDSMTYPYLYKVADCVSLHEAFTEAVADNDLSEAKELASEIIANVQEMEQRHIF